MCFLAQNRSEGSTGPLVASSTCVITSVFDLSSYLTHRSYFETFWVCFFFFSGLTQLEVKHTIFSIPEVSPSLGKGREL